jgi:DNA repair exonuclease SbcCD ATPase subunit
VIYFKTIRWKNLLSTGNQFTEINLNASEPTLIVGKNGSGKSSLLCSLTFVLFGKPFRNINKPQLLNTITKKDLLVELEFSIGKNEYMIRRGMKPNIFEVYCNNILLNQSAEMRDYQEILEKQILKSNYKTFCQVDILGSASFVPFMQLAAAQRRSVIEDLLDLQVFTTMNTLLKEQIQENTSALLKNDYEKRMNEEMIQMVTNHLNDVRSKSEQYIREKQTALLDLNSKYETFNSSLEEIKQEVQDISNTLDDDAKLNKKTNQFRELKTQLETKQVILKQEIKFFEQHESCPTCNQNISSNLKCESIDSRLLKLNELEASMVLLAEKKKQHDLKITEQETKLSRLEELKNNYKNINYSIKHVQEQINSIKTDIQSVKKDINTTSDLKIADLEQRKALIIQDYNSLQEDKKVLSVAASLLKDGGIKTKIINQYIPIINKLINKYLSAMDFFVDFQLNSQFEETIKSRHRDEFSYSSFSEGEKQKIDLALLFTWRAVAKLRNSMSTNLLILDEVMDGSLDTNSLDMLMHILSTISENTSLFVISHREQMNEKFPNTIRFIKHKNFSHIEGQ